MLFSDTYALFPIVPKRSPFRVCDLHPGILEEHHARHDGHHKRKRKNELYDEEYGSQNSGDDRELPFVFL